MWSRAAQCEDDDTTNTVRLKGLNPTRDKEPEDVMIRSWHRIKELSRTFWYFM